MMLNSGVPQPFHAFVCITGQAARLEIAHKSRSLLVPLQKVAHVKLSLVLSNGLPLFSNIGRSCSNTSAMLSLWEISRRVRKVTPEAEVTPLPVAADPAVNTKYLGLLHKDVITNRRRLKSHVHPWTASSYCFGRMDRWERSLGYFFDIFIRIRDDAIVPRLHVENLLVELMRYHGTLGPLCDSWGGLNDKVTFGVRSAAFSYFNAPILLYVNGRTPNVTRLNPEKYWMWAVKNASVPHRLVPPNYLVALGTRIKNGTLCLKCSTNYASHLSCYTHKMAYHNAQQFISACC
jgi:hypothetical protein